MNAWEQQIIDQAKDDPQRAHMLAVHRGADKAAAVIAKHFGLGTPEDAVASSPAEEFVEDDDSINL